MTLYRIYIISIIAVLLGFTSCEDNYEFSNIEETISDPIEYDATTIVGRVLNSSNQAIAYADIQVRHHGIISSIKSDENGNYALELPQDGNRILLQVNADQYLRSAVDAVFLDDDVKQNYVRLLQEDEIDYNGNINALGANQLAVISGRVLLNDGNPAENITIILVDLSSLRFEAYDVTSIDGYYSFASEPFENFVLFAVSKCQGAELIVQDFSLDSADIDLGVFESNFTPISQFSITGFVTDCNTGEGLINGTVQITFDGNSTSFIGKVKDGQYNLEIDNCENATCYNVQISSPQLIEGILEVDCEEITGGFMEVDYTLCGEEVVYEGEVRLLVGSDSLIFTQAIAEFDPSGLLSIAAISTNLTSGFIVVSDGNSIGVHGIKVLQLSENGEGILEQFEGSGVPYSLEIIEINEYVTGNLSGDVFNSEGTTVPLSGTFNIKL